LTCVKWKAPYDRRSTLLCLIMEIDNSRQSFNVLIVMVMIIRDQRLIF